MENLIVRCNEVWCREQADSRKSGSILDNFIILRYRAEKYMSASILYVSIGYQILIMDLKFVFNFVLILILLSGKDNDQKKLIKINLKMKPTISIICKTSIMVGTAQKQALKAFSLKMTNKKQ